MGRGARVRGSSVPAAPAWDMSRPDPNARRDESAVRGDAAPRIGSQMELDLNLKSTRLCDRLASNYHPAFRELQTTI
jgi:hypothetical protein